MVFYGPDYFCLFLNSAFKVRRCAAPIAAGCPWKVRVRCSGVSQQHTCDSRRCVLLHLLTTDKSPAQQGRPAKAEK